MSGTGGWQTAGGQPGGRMGYVRVRRGEDERQVLEVGKQLGVSLEVEWGMSESDEERTIVRYWRLANSRGSKKVEYH